VTAFAPTNNNIVPTASRNAVTPTSSLSLTSLSYGTPKSTSTNNSSTALVAPGTQFNLNMTRSTPVNTNQGGGPSPWPGRIETAKTAATYGAAAAGVGLLAWPAYAAVGTLKVSGLAAGTFSTMGANFSIAMGQTMSAVGGAMGTATAAIGKAMMWAVASPAAPFVLAGAAVAIGLTWLFTKGKDKIRDSHAVEIFNGSRDSGDGEGAKAVLSAVKGDGYSSFFVQQKRINTTQAAFIKKNGGFTRDSITKAVEEGVVTAAQGKEMLNVIFFGLTKDGRVASASTRSEDKASQGIIDTLEKGSSKTSQAGFLASHLAKFDSLYASRKPPSNSKSA